MVKIPESLSILNSSGASPGATEKVATLVARATCSGASHSSQQLSVTALSHSHSTVETIVVHCNDKTIFVNSSKCNFDALFVKHFVRLLPYCHYIVTHLSNVVIIMFLTRCID